MQIRRRPVGIELNLRLVSDFLNQMGLRVQTVQVRLRVTVALRSSGSTG